MSGANAIMQILKAASVIPERYTGQVVLHIGEGNLCNVEPRERPRGTEYFDRLQGMATQKVLDNPVFCAMIGNNTV